MLGGQGPSRTVEPRKKNVRNNLSLYIFIAEINPNYLRRWRQQRDAITFSVQEDINDNKKYTLSLDLILNQNLPV
jgi:hypothetical protein